MSRSPEFPKAAFTHLGGATFAGGVTIATTNSPGLKISKDKSVDNRFLRFNDTASGGKDYDIINNGNLAFYNHTDNNYILQITSAGNATFAGTLDIGGNTTATKVSDTTIESKATTAGAFFKANSGANGYFGLELYQGTTAKWFVGSYTDHASLAATDFAIVSGNKANGNVRLKIDSSGNFSLNGGLLGLGNASSTPNISYGMFHYNAVGLGVYSSASGATQGIGFWLNNGSAYEAGRWLSNGNLGIGTTSPSDLQHNVITSNGTALHLNNTTGGAGAFVDLDFTTYALTGTNPDAAASIRVIDNGAHGGHITFRSKGSGMGASQSEIVRFEQGGNVGIGTTSPNARLSLGNAGGQQFYVYEGGNVRAGLGVDMSGSSRELSVFHSSSDASNGNISFGYRLDSNGSYVERMRLTGAGDVSIGTTSHQGKFTVVGATQTCNFDLDANAEVGLSIMGLHTSNKVGITIGKANSSKNSGVFRYVHSSDGGNNNYVGIGHYAADDILNITSGGFVGIGNTNPSQKLHVTGSILASSDVVAFSDIKLKENIKTLDGSKVYDMRGVSFTRKDTGKDSSGVIAQEIQKIAPELVTDNDGTLSVAYGNLTGYLIEAVKELKAEIEELKKQIK